MRVLGSLQASVFLRAVANELMRAAIDSDAVVMQGQDSPAPPFCQAADL